MKQKEDSTCILVVAAMIIGSSVDYPYTWMKNYGYGEPPYPIFGLNHFLACNGIQFGIGANVEDDYISRRTDEIIVAFRPLYAEAVLTVQSERFDDTLHVIYWDTHQIWDPNPYCEDGRPFSDYSILEWWPIQRIEY